MRIAVRLCIPLAIAAACDEQAAQLGKFRSSQHADQGYPQSPPDVYALAENDSVADRIHAMSFSEIAGRLGAHRQRSELSFAFVRGKNRVSMKEESLIVQARNNDFLVRVSNDGAQGYELIWTGGRLFARNRFGPFHERAALDGLHLTQRERASRAWAAVYRLYRGRLGFSKQGIARHHGRDALRFSIGLNRKEARLSGTADFPPAPEGVTRYVYPVEPSPSQLDRWRDKAMPQRAAGSLLADMDSGCILMVDFSGMLAWDGEEGQPITLEIRALIQSDGFGNPPEIPPPPDKDIAPLPERIAVETHPLDPFFGKGFTAGLGPPAGVAAKRAEPDAGMTGESQGGEASKP
ncbi:MAG: hypothetical protein JXR96_25910 [Deltaproteobacteria bacterium]|nr:hypothetical protein [Deltaproteobacteria bacterium]